MKSLLLVLTMIAACSIKRHVTVLLGPDPDTPSSGFLCNDPATGKSIFGRALSGGMLKFQVVVDLIDVGAHVPSCVGEDIVDACQDGTCKATVSDAPMRYCIEVSITPASTDGHVIAQQVFDALRADPSLISSSAPHAPVIVRAVATTEPCSALQHATSGVWTTLDPSAVLGCAYSCPVNLDTVDGDLSLGIGIDITRLTADQCVSVIQECATAIGG